MSKKQVKEIQATKAQEAKSMARVIHNEARTAKVLLQSDNTTKALTQDSLNVFIHGIDEDYEGVSNTRLGVFSNQAVVTDMASFKDAVKQCAKTNKDDKAMTVRLSEVRQIYGAIRFCSLNVKNHSYHDAVKTARGLLDDRGIKFDGSKKLTADESEAAKLGRMQAKAAREVNKTYDFTKADALANLPEAIADKLAELQQEALEDSQSKAMDKIQSNANSIIEKLGYEYAKALARVLMTKVVLHEKETNTELVAIAA